MPSTPTAKDVADVEAALKLEAEKAEAQAKADAEAADAKAKGLLADVEAEVEHVWVAVKDFSARHLTQLLSFKKGDELTHDVASALAAKGAPVRPVE